AVRVEERGQLARDLVRDRPQVAGRHHHVVGKRAVATDADAHGVGAQVLLAGAAVAAVAADQVALGRHPLAGLVARHAWPDRRDPADELVADHQPRLDRALAPFVPQVDVQVGAADRGLFHPDQHLVRPRRGNRDFFHPHALGGLALDQRAHGGGDLAGLGHRAFACRKGKTTIIRGRRRSTCRPLSFRDRRMPPARAAAVLATLAMAPLPASASHGTCVPQQLPEIAGPLRDAGLRLAPEQLADLAGDPMGAVVSLGGCTASFVSPEGLVATNHHCAYGAIQLNSTADNNLMHSGFYAPERGAELSAGPNARIFVLDAIRDVTAQVQGAIDAAPDPIGRTRALEFIEKRLVA